MPTSARRETQYIPTLDGWRALAILWVLIVHTPPHIYGGVSTAPLAVANGVDLFFALSGFLICTRLLREEALHTSISLRHFYIRRIFRIQPAALAYLAVLSLLGLVQVIALRWSGVAAAALMVRNLYPPFSRLYPEWYSGHFWSLAVEEHFYLLFPLLLMVVRRHRLAILSALVVALEIWHWVVYKFAALQGGAVVLEFRTDMAIRFILIGCVVAAAIRHPRIEQLAERRLQPWVALLIAAAIFTTISVHHSRINQALLVPVYPLLILSTVLHPGTPVGRFLELAPVRFLGRISFSLYLWQQLFFFPYPSSSPNLFREHVLLRWTCALACALLSYYCIERPCIRLGHRLTA